MSVAERWARTQDQVDLMLAARRQGGLCAWCGRTLYDDQTVYIEQFLIGERRVRGVATGIPRSIAHAPVGIECASPYLIEQAAGQVPEPCVTCGRGVFYRQARPGRQYVSCSRRCASRSAVARQRSRSGTQ